MKHAIAIVGIGLFLTACASGADSPSTSSVVLEARSSNVLAFNSLMLTAPEPNKLAQNPLAGARLDQHTLSLNPASGLEATREGRELLHYVAQCALPPDEILVAEHDGVEYKMPGLIGAAPTWVNQPLEPSERGLITACLLAHVNAYGAPVPISVRSPTAILTTPSENIDYPLYEGTFFGDIFDGKPRLFACTGTNTEIATALSLDRAMRVCADASSDCAIPVVGRCRDVCDSYASGYGWQDCWAEGQRYTTTVSTYLRAEATHDTCADGESCGMVLLNDDGLLVCAPGNRCDMACLGESYCALEAADAGRVQALVWQPGAQAAIGCQGAAECSVTCMGQSKCEIDCKDASQCSAIYCANDASCLLDCTGAGSCGFAACPSGQVSECPGGIKVCGRACP